MRRWRASTSSRPKADPTLEKGRPGTSSRTGPRARCWSRGRRPIRTTSPADKNLLQLLRDNPDLWERIKNGQVTLNNVVCKTPTADLSLIERTTKTPTLQACTIEELDAKISP